ncbi:hypothetical protein DFH09DRAFT_1092881 [Mycena vulgaris]|nr:hypothetical protein DFH09DRAFT_1092881 [Mycena vulgaris]
MPKMDNPAIISRGRIRQRGIDRTDTGKWKLAVASGIDSNVRCGGNGEDGVNSRTEWEKRNESFVVGRALRQEGPRNPPPPPLPTPPPTPPPPCAPRSRFSARTIPSSACAAQRYTLVKAKPAGSNSKQCVRGRLDPLSGSLSSSLVMSGIHCAFALPADSRAPQPHVQVPPKIAHKVESNTDWARIGTGAVCLKHGGASTREADGWRVLATAAAALHAGRARRVGQWRGAGSVKRGGDTCVQGYRARAALRMSGLRGKGAVEEEEGGSSGRGCVHAGAAAVASPVWARDGAEQCARKQQRGAHDARAARAIAILIEPTRLAKCKRKPKGGAHRFLHTGGRRMRKMRPGDVQRCLVGWVWPGRGKEVSARRWSISIGAYGAGRVRESYGVVRARGGALWV